MRARQREKRGIYNPATTMMKHVCIPDEVAHGYIHSYIIHHLLNGGLRRWRRQSKEPPTERCASAISADSESAERRKREALLLLLLSLSSSLSSLLLWPAAATNTTDDESNLKVARNLCSEGVFVLIEFQGYHLVRSFEMDSSPELSYIGGPPPPSSGLIVNRRHRRRRTVVGLALNHVSTEETT